MALAIDASTPAIAVNSVSGTATVTTASFTPPAGALLLVMWAANNTSTTNPSTPGITDSLGSPLTYNLLDWRSHVDTGPQVQGQVATWWAVVGSSAAMTVTVTNNNNDPANKQSALAVVVITGQHATPIGAHGKAGSASAASIAQSYTAQATGGWGFLVSCDWDATGTDTAGTGCTLLPSGSGTIAPSQISYGFERRSSADDSNGVSNTLNLTLPATSTNLQWAYVEVVPASSGSSFDAQVSVTRQQSSVTRVGPVVVAPTIGPPQVIQLPQITVVRHVKQPPAPFPIAANPPLLPAGQPEPSAPVWVNPSRTQPFLAAVTSITPPPLPQPPAPITVIPSRSQPPLSATITLTLSPLPQATAPIVVVTSTWQPRPPQIVVAQPQFPPPVAGILPAAPILVAAAFVRPGFLPASVSPPPFLGPSALPPAPILVVPTFTRPGALPCRVSPPQLISVPGTSGQLSPSTSSGRLGSVSAAAALAESTASARLAESTSTARMAPTTSGGDA